MIGSLKQKLFNGTISIDDPNLAMNFDGIVDFNQAIPKYQLTAEIDRAYLKEINLSERPFVLQTKAYVNFSGDKLDNADGTIVVEDFILSEDTNSFKLNKLEFAAITTDDHKDLSIKSDILNAQINGVFQFSEVINNIKDILNGYIVVDRNIDFQKFANIDVDYKLSIYKADNIIEFFLPELHLKDTVLILGQLNTAKGQLDGLLKVKALEYMNWELEDIGIQVGSNDNELSGLATIGEIEYGDQYILTNNGLSLSIAKDSMYVNVSIDNDSSKNSLSLNGIVVSDKEEGVMAKILPSLIKLNGKNWVVNNENSIQYYEKNMKVNNLTFSQGEQTIIFNMTNPDSLIVFDANLANFNLADYSQLFMRGGQEIDGLLSGRLNAKLFEDFYADFEIKNFSLNNDTLGDIDLDVYKKLNSQYVYLNGNILSNRRSLAAKGYYKIIYEGEDSFNLKATSKHTPIAFIQEYFPSISDLQGEASIDVALVGTIRQPVITGQALLHDISTKVNYLQVNYFIPNGKILFKKNNLHLDQLEVFDPDGNLAYLSGDINHNYLTDFSYDVNIASSRFLFLNTTAKDNSSYYGKVYAGLDNKARLIGDAKYSIIDIKATTDKGTSIFIPINESTDIGEYDFIEFAYIDTVEEKVEDVKSAKTFILDMKLNITPEAEGEIIFDQQAGDVIRARGRGNISMSINTNGTFNIFGTYIIERGNYLFTLKGPVEGIYVLNKRFTIESGSKINWSGSPYDATIDVDALYRLRASLPDRKSYRVATDVILNLRGSLLSPNVSFNVRTAGSENASLSEPILERIKRDEVELNRQVFGLLVMNRFLPSQFGSTDAINSSRSTSVSEFVSRELSILASKISKDIDFNFNLYTYDLNSGDVPVDPDVDPTTKQQELQLGVSKRFLDDRLTIDVGGNVGLNQDDAGIIQDDNSAGNVSGDFNIEYSLTPDGRLKVKAFRKNAYDIFVERNQNKTGVGFFYRKSFDRLSELWKGFRSDKQQPNEEKEEIP